MRFLGTITELPLRRKYEPHLHVKLFSGISWTYFHKQMCTPFLILTINCIFVILLLNDDGIIIISYKRDVTAYDHLKIRRMYNCEWFNQLPHKRPAILYTLKSSKILNQIKIKPRLSLHKAAYSLVLKKKKLLDKFFQVITKIDSSLIARLDDNNCNYANKF